MQRKRGIYEKYIKRLLDITCSLLTIIIFGWLYIIIAMLVRFKLGKPVVFKQLRPGVIDPKTGQERLFYIYKFRTMTNERDENGYYLPDNLRLTKFGKMLRRSSMDELLEIFNILKGDMSIIGPRPQLVRDMVFMSEEIRMRHTVKPGLSGLAQVNGRNAVTWEQKFELDLKYIEKISFLGDFKILIKTIIKVFGHGESDSELDVTVDYGEELLKNGMVSQIRYDELQLQAKELIVKFQRS